MAKKKRMRVPEDQNFRGNLTTMQYFYGRTKQEVEKKATAYFNDYHPMGYDTKFDQAVHQHIKGYWCCVISRYNSCD
jgi:hypothetical protein